MLPIIEQNLLNNKPLTKLNREPGLHSDKAREDVMEKKLETHMVQSPHVCSPKVPLHEASVLMRELNFRHLPVVQDGELMGILSERNLREALAYPGGKNLQVQDVMNSNVYAVQKNTALKKVVRNMANLKLGSAVVVDTQKRVIGIFTTTDALALLADLLDENEGERYVLSEDFYESWLPLMNVRV